MVIVWNNYFMQADVQQAGNKVYYVQTPEPSRLPNAICRGVKFEFKSLICLARLPAQEIFPRMQHVYRYLDFVNIEFSVETDVAAARWEMFLEPLPEYIHNIVVNCFDQLAIPAGDANSDPFRFLTTDSN